MVGGRIWVDVGGLYLDSHAPMLRELASESPLAGLVDLAAVVANRQGVLEKPHRLGH